MHRIEKKHLVELENWIEKLPEGTPVFSGLAEILEIDRNNEVRTYGAVMVNDKIVEPFEIWVIAKDGDLSFPLKNLTCPSVPATECHRSASKALEALSMFRRHIYAIHQCFARIKNPRLSQMLDSRKEGGD